jgi:hypothetical protein
VVEAGSVTMKSPLDSNHGSQGQFSIDNAARSWATLWDTMISMGCQPTTAPRSSLPVRVNFRIGGGYSIDGLISNPRFLEHLMAWPIGWSAPGEPVTGYAAWLRRSRIELSRLTSLAIARDRELANEA